MNGHDKAGDAMRRARFRGISLGLERATRLAGLMKDPQDKMSFIHITGTNGKGSTLCFISSILTEMGLKVGSYSSPSVINDRDQFRINGEIISKERYSACMEEVIAAAEEMTDREAGYPTAFEIETVMAFLLFVREGCDIAVVETGLGGEKDATNILNTALIHVITRISEDHLHVIGDSLEEIAECKCGIIKTKAPTVAVSSDERISQIIRRRCEAFGSHLTLLGPDDTVIRLIREGDLPLLSFDHKDIKDLRPSMQGLYQAENASLAIEAVKILFPQISPDVIKAGIRKAVWPLRFEIIREDPLIILDGAHNPGGAMCLRDSLASLYSGHKKLFIAGIFKDKDHKKIVGIMSHMADKVFTVETPGSDRALDAVDLCREFIEAGDEAKACTSLEQAVSEAALMANGYRDKVMIVCFGSLSFLSGIKECFMGIKSPGTCRYEDRQQRISDKG